MSNLRWMTDNFSFLFFNLKKGADISLHYFCRFTALAKYNYNKFTSFFRYTNLQKVYIINQLIILIVCSI